MKKCLLAVNLCVLLLTACRKDPPLLSVKNSFLTFQIGATRNTELIPNDINCIVYDTLVVGVTGNNNSRDSLIANFTTTGITVTVNGILQVSGETVNDFSKSVVYVVTAQNGTERRYTVKLKTFTGLPILYLTTEGPIISKDDYVNGTMKIDGNQEYTEGLYDGKIEIRGRGNSTWYQPKKPYKIKLASKSSILGMPQDKEWALLANYMDKSLLRNDLAFELSEMMEAAWTPRRRQVEVFINGLYNGNYLLTETIKSGDDRVDISVKNGGYLLEVNFKEKDEGDIRIPSEISPMDIKEGNVNPDSIMKEVDYIHFLLRSYSFDPAAGYQKYFDLDAFVSWYLVNEIMMNNDAIFYSSVFIQKDNATSKVKMGPVWDFDLSSGNVSYNSMKTPEGWYLKQGAFVQFVWNDPYFQAAVKAKWNRFKPQLLALSKFLDSKEQYLELSAKENFKLWDILNVALPNNVVVPGSFHGEVDYFRTWLTHRVKWMDAEINK